MTVLAGRTILITGATAGLGRAIAEGCWAAGANVVAVGRSPERLRELTTRLGARAGQTLRTVAADLSRDADLETVAAMLRAPGIDVLVNNAAVQGPVGPVWENDFEEWRQALALDLLVPVALSRAFCLAPMTDRRRKIINVSGGGATAARANFSAYATAKAALVRFSEGLALEAAALRIDVNCVAPGAMPSAMTQAIVNAGADRAGTREVELALAVAAKGDACFDAPVRLCRFLASAESDGITGKLLSAVWDPWQTLPGVLEELSASDIYTLRRILPEDRGKAWAKS